MARTLLALIAGLVVVIVVVALGPARQCHPGDPGIKIGNMLVAGCP